jgi:hypothetical protein
MPQSTIHVDVGEAVDVPGRTPGPAQWCESSAPSLPWHPNGVLPDEPFGRTTKPSFRSREGDAMAAFILTWKEDVWPYEALRRVIDVYQRDGVVEEPWRVSANRAAKPGDLAFLLKQGADPRGIFGFGYFLDSPTLREDPADLGRPRMRAKTRFVRLSDPKTQPLLIPVHELFGRIPDWQITAQASGQAPLSNEAETWLRQRLRVPDDPNGVFVPADVDPIGPTTGPVPSEWTGVVERNVQWPAATYALRFGNRSLWKIGHAQDIKDRLEDINNHIPVEVLNERWELALLQRWPNSMAAYEMEQKVLELLAGSRTVGERVLCSQRELETAWGSATTFVRAWLRRNAQGSDSQVAAGLPAGLSTTHESAGRGVSR